MAHLLASAHKSVQRLHQLAWVETVALTKVDKQSAVTLLRLVLQLLLVALLASVLLFRHHRLNLWCVGIVGQELTKLKRYNLLNQLVLVDILKVAVDILHEWGNLLVVNVGLNNLVHHLIQLLFADLFGRRNLGLYKLFADNLLDVTDLELFATVYNRDRCTFLARTACTT